MAINGRGRPTKDQKAATEKVNRFLKTIAAYERDFKKWEQRTDKIIKRYSDENRNDAQSKFNVLWSNVQTLVPATYSKLPQPDVSRRFRDQDPVGRVAALIVERGLDFEITHYPDYRAMMNSCVLDRFLGGRGTAWARYEPHIQAQAQSLPTDGVEVTEDEDEPQEELKYECAPVDYVHWKDFGHSVARTWEEVGMVWRKVYMTRRSCVERFGDEGEKIPLDSRPESDKQDKVETEDSRALIYEIWDKSDKRAYWLSKSLGKFVDERDDPLGLEGFWPCPKPLYATLTNDSLIPVPDFTLYQDQARSLDVLCDRIDGLIRALQVKGVYNSEFKELGRLFTEGENNTLIPVKNFAAFAEKMGLKGAIDIVDLTPIYSALQAAYEAFQQVLKQIYDITGLADIVRGQSEASETATAQQIKGQYASLRLNAMKHAVALFATETLQLKAQIMLNKFQPETLQQIAAVDQLSPQDQELVPQAMELLKNNPMQSFRIEIATDSMVQIDEQEEKAARTEFLTAIGGYLKQAEPVLQTSPLLAPLVLDMLKFAAGAFKVGKTLEGVIDETAEKIKQATEQKMQQPPPPDPEMLKVQQKQQADQAQLQADQQRDQMTLQMEAQRSQMEMQQREREIQMEAAARQRELQFEAFIEQQRSAMEAEREQARMQMEAMLQRYKIQADNETKIEVAQIGAEATLSAAQTTAAETATKE